MLLKIMCEKNERSRRGSLKTESAVCCHALGKSTTSVHGVLRWKTAGYLKAAAKNVLTVAAWKVVSVSDSKAYFRSIFASTVCSSCK